MNLIIKEKGSLNIREGTLCFKGDNSFVEKYPIETVSNIFAFANVNLSFALIRELKSHSINLFFFDPIRKEYMELVNNHNYCGDTLVKQVQCYLDNGTRLAIAKSIVDAEVHNLAYSLLSYRYHPSDIAYFSTKRKEARKCPSLPRLMLIEALCQKRYYEHIAALASMDGFVFKSRKAFRPTDPINQMITYLNGVLYAEVLSLLIEAGLNPAISYNHSSNERPYSLQLDFADIYKPLLVEKTILGLIHNKVVVPANFKEGDRLPPEVRKALVNEFHSRLRSVVKIDKRFRTYEDVIRDDAYKLRSYVKGKATRLHFFCCSW